MNGSAVQQAWADGLAAATHQRFADQAVTPRARTGFQRGNRAGSSLDYKDFRDYQPGDDLRHIDWNAYARSDRLIVKRFHEEVTPHLDLVIDGSASMALADTRKAEALYFLTAFFTATAAQSGYSLQIYESGQHWRPLDRLPDLALTPDLKLDGAVSPAEARRRRDTRLRRAGLRVLLSDLLWPDEPGDFLSHFSNDAAGVVVIQLLAARDQDPGLGGMLRFHDSETNQQREIQLNAAARHRYLETLARHNAAWSEAARRYGATLATFEAETLLRQGNLDHPALHRVLS